MVVWNHCAFVDRLMHKSREFKRCKIEEITEEYTSKTCGCCGRPNQKLGGSKTFSCENCKSIFDRDVNGAHNIYLKYHTELQKSRVAL